LKEGDDLSFNIEINLHLLQMSEDEKDLNKEEEEMISR